MKLGTTNERDTGAYGKLKESEIDGKKVSFWEKTWAEVYPSLVEGFEVEFDIVEKEKNGYKNFTAYPKKDPANRTTGAYRGGSGAITKAMEKKEASIEKFQDNKEEGIKISATMRDAVLCAIAEYNKDPHNLDTLEELIRKWRKTLWFEWDKYSEYPPFL